MQKGDKIDALLDLLSGDGECSGSTLIFVETKREADFVERELVRAGVDAISIHGDRSQREREHAIDLFRSQKVPALVATDVASRGLDIPNVAWVINYDMPNNIDSYVHRIGRTGRCGNKGNAISFINDNNKPILSDLHKLLQEGNQEVPSWFNDLVKRNVGYSNYGGARR